LEKRREVGKSGLDILCPPFLCPLFNKEWINLTKNETKKPHECGA